MQGHAYVQVSPGSSAVSDTPARAEPDLATPVTSCCLGGGARALSSRAAPIPFRGDARGRGAQPAPSRKRAASCPAPPKRLSHQGKAACGATSWVTPTTLPAILHSQPLSSGILKAPHSLDAPHAHVHQAVGDAVASTAWFYFPKSLGCVKNHGSCAFSDAKQERRVLEFL